MNKAVELRAIAAEAAFRAEDWLPLNLASPVNHQTALPRIAKNKTLTQRIEKLLPQIPIEFAERLIRMFSFVGDTVLDPFMGTGTTNAAAGLWGRNSKGIEVDPEYFTMSEQRIGKALHKYTRGIVLPQRPLPGGKACTTEKKNSAPWSGIAGRAEAIN